MRRDFYRNSFTSQEFNFLAEEINKRDSEVPIFCNQNRNMNPIKDNSAAFKERYKKKKFSLMGVYSKGVTADMIEEDYIECCKLWEKFFFGSKQEQKEKYKSTRKQKRGDK